MLSLLSALSRENHCFDFIFTRSHYPCFCIRWTLLLLLQHFNRVSSRDTGKTMIDASLGEIMTTCEKITWLLSEGEKWLKPEYRYITSPVFLTFLGHNQCI